MYLCACMHAYMRSCLYLWMMSCFIYRKISSLEDEVSFTFHLCFCFTISLLYFVVIEVHLFWFLWQHTISFVIYICLAYFPWCSTINETIKKYQTLTDTYPRFDFSVIFLQSLPLTRSIWPQILLQSKCLLDLPCIIIAW